MKRTFSYNVIIIISSAALLMFIVFTLLAASKIQTTGNLNATLVLLAVEFILISLAAIILKMYLKFIKGDLGEMAVERILEKLPQGYYYLRDFAKEEKGNIDFIVIGESGIWTIEVKNLSKRLIIHDKYLEKQLKQAYAEAKELESILVQLGYTFPVMPILVFANKVKIDFGMRPINGVYVIGKSWLEELLTKHSSGQYLGAGQAYAVKEKLKSYTTKF